MRRMDARWMVLGPKGIERLDRMPKIFPANRTGNGRQRAVREPGRWAALVQREKVRKDKILAKMAAWRRFSRLREWASALGRPDGSEE